MTNDRGGEPCTPHGDNLLKEVIIVYITLYDCGLFILIMITVIVSAYLIAALRQAFFLLAHVRKILITHDSDIHEMLSLLPIALGNINLLNVSLVKMADQTSRAFQSLETDIMDRVDNLHDGVKTLIVYAKVISGIFKSIFSKIV